MRHLKHTTGWFAAGREVQQAATLLSDAAFKLFVWLCLHAERTSGILWAPPGDLARALGKTTTDIAHSLDELCQAGVCRWDEYGRIEIEDRFWPYERAHAERIRDSGNYVAAVRRIFLRQACAQGSFGAADEQLALDWNRRGISLRQVEQAVLLGTLRKYAALLNHDGGTPITTLHYFSPLIDEVLRTDVSADYWKYVSHKVKV